MRATSFHLAPVAVDPAAPAGDVIAQLRNIRPAHRSRTSRVADFVFRRKTSVLTPGALVVANRAHTSRFFGAALAHNASKSGNGQADPMAALIEHVRPGKGQPGDAFERAKTFAEKFHGDAATLLSKGGEEFRQELKSALVKNGMGATRAGKSVEVIYTALVAQFAAGNETERRKYYGDALDLLQAGGLNLGAQLEILTSLENALAAETLMSDEGKAEVAADLASMGRLLQPGATALGELIEITTRDLTTETPAKELNSRLRELDDHLLSIKDSADLTDRTRERLTAAVAQSRTLVETLKARTQDLQKLTGHGRLQGALRDLKDARKYVAARQGLAYATGKVAPGLHEALLKQLDKTIARPQAALLLADVNAGNPQIIDLMLPGALWDELAYTLKASALDPAAQLAMVNVQAQHELRQAARAMDDAMQATAFKSSVSKSLGKGKAEYARLPANAFQALKADAVLIGWFVQHAPKTLGERDLAIANWIKLSLHDNATGRPDAAKQAELFAQLRARGLDTRQIELHAAQGFRSSADVQDCANQIRAFSKALQGSATAAAASVDARARATQIGMDLLQGLGIAAKSIDDPDIDAQAKQLIDRALQQNKGTRDLFRALRRIAIMRVALESNDPKFTTAGGRPGATYSKLIMDRMSAMGMNFHSTHRAMQDTVRHLEKKLPKDTRTLDELCRDADPKRGSSGVKSAFGREGQKRRESNEAGLKAALAQLKPNESIAITFGATVEVSASTPVLPGLSVGADMQADWHNSIRVSRTADAAFNVELLAGTSTREGGSLTTVMDALSLRLGASHQRDKGHRLAFDSQSDCQNFLVAVANGGDVSGALEQARTVEAAAHASSEIDISLTATADLKIATLSARLAAGAGETHSIHESGRIQREVFSRNVRAEAVLRAAAAGNLASGQLGVGVDLGVRRTIVRENETLVGGPPGSFNADRSPTLSMVAVVGDRNLGNCLNTLLPGASDAQRQSIEAQLGQVPKGTELFTQYRLKEEARAKANVLLGQAESNLRQARMTHSQAALDSVVALLRQADAVTRTSANYTPEGFGWTLRSTSEIEKSRGVYKEVAQRAGEQTHFIKFDLAGQAGIGQSLLLSAMS